MSDLDERDQVSSWCWDGMCEHCDNDWCDHRCHDKASTGTNYVTGIVGLYALGGWAAIGAASVIPDGWPGLARWSLTALFVVMAVVLVRTVESGLRGDQP